MSKPQPPTTYVSEPHIEARISLLQRAPQPDESLYRRLLDGILQWNFTTNEGYSACLEDRANDRHPLLTVLKLLTKPGGSAYEYDFLLSETKVPGESWATSEEHLHRACSLNHNESKNCYAMLQIGCEVQFYKHQDHCFETVGPRLHLLNDAQDVIARCQRMKAHPMPFVY